MTIHAIVHKVDAGGYWAEVPCIPGCATQAETMEELCENLRTAVAGCLSAPVVALDLRTSDRVIELAV